MNRATTRLALAVGFLGFAAVSGQAQDQRDLALQARAVMKQHCYRCHHGDGSEGGDFDVLKDQSLSAKREDGEKPYVIPSKPDESFLLQRVEKGTMPPKTIRERPTDEEKAVLRKW